MSTNIIGTCPASEPCPNTLLHQLHLRATLTAPNRVCPWGWGLCTRPPGARYAGPVHAESAEIQLVSLAQLSEQRQVQTVPHTCRLPIAQPSLAGHAAAKAQLLRQFLPWDARTQYEDDAVERLLVAQAGPPALGGRRHDRQQWRQLFVQRCADFLVPVSTHALPNAQRGLRDDTVLLAALRARAFALTSLGATSGTAAAHGVVPDRPARIQSGSQSMHIGSNPKRSDRDWK